MFAGFVSRFSRLLRGRFVPVWLVLIFSLGWWVFPRAGNVLRWPLRLVLVASLAGLLWQIWRGSFYLGRAWPPIVRLTRRLEWTGRWRERWEMALAAAVIALAAWHLGLEMRAMAQASLIGDEIGSVRLYSAGGPLRVVTDYSLAKNHVFFNFVNSLFPGRGSLDPLRARLISFLAVGGAWLFLVAAGWRRRFYLETALAAGLIGLNHRLLEVSLQARGYGFLLALALLGCLALLDYLQTGRRRCLAVLGATVALATYTVPSFLVFGGTLWLLLFFATRRLEVFRWGLLTAAIIGALYLPIFRQVLAVAGRYEDAYGVSYRQMSNVFTTIRYAVLPEIWEGKEAGFFLVLAVLAAAPLIGRWGARPVWKTLQIFLASSAVFVSFCLFLETPPVRITAFLAAPLVLSIAVFVGLIHRSPAQRWLQPWIALGLLGGLGTVGAWLVRNYDFQPRSHWQEVAQLALNLTPPGGSVWIEDQLTDLRAYTGSRLRLATGKIPGADIATGHLLLIENHRIGEIQPLVTGPLWRRLDVGNRKNTFRRLWFSQTPELSQPSPLIIRGPSPEAAALLADGNATTGYPLLAAQKIQLECESAVALRSLNLWSRQPWNEVEMQVATQSGDGNWRPLEKTRILVEDKIISLDLAGIAARKVRLALVLKTNPHQLTEIFAVPPTPPPISNRLP